MASELTPAPVGRSPWRRWVDFWFPAADPTTLGFVRIATGLLVLYTHLSYSVDLQQFFGKTGWYAQRYVNRERQEFPWQVQPFLEWGSESVVSAKASDFPHRRKAVIDFIRALPTDAARRAAALRFLERAAQTKDPLVAQAVLDWVRRMGLTDGERSLAALVAGKSGGGGLPAGAPQVILNLNVVPQALLDLDRPEREQVAEEVRALWTVLPKSETDREYVLAHLVEIPPDVRAAFVRFLLALPAGTTPEAQQAREEKIKYLDYWNNEPEKALRTGHSIFSVWFHVTDPTQMAVIHAGVLLAIVLFTLGLFTRVTSAVVWVAVVGYIHRTQQILFGMDTMMNILLLYLMIGNSGAALSLDRLIARYRAARASLRRTGGIDAPTRAFLASPPPSATAGFGQRLIQVHFCFIYIAAGLSKLKGSAWWDGRATWDVLVNPEFTLIRYGWYEDALRAFASVKPLYYSATVIGAWFTLFVEIAGPFLMWTRLRWFVILISSAMHAAIGVLMGLNLFELLMMVMLVAYMPDGVIRDRLRGGLGLARLRFGFNPAAAPSARAAALVAAVDTDSQVELAPDPARTVPTLADADGHALTGPAGVRALFRSVRLLSALGPVLWVPGVKGLLARWLFPAPPEPSPPTPSAASKPPAPTAPTAAS
jgi:hypothetical protein